MLYSKKVDTDAKPEPVESADPGAPSKPAKKPRKPRAKPVDEPAPEPTDVVEPVADKPRKQRKPKQPKETPAVAAPEEVPAPTPEAAPEVEAVPVPEPIVQVAEPAPAVVQEASPPPSEEGKKKRKQRGEDEPPAWFKTFVKNAKMQEEKYRETKKPKKQIREEAVQLANKTWQDPYHRDTINHESEQHMRKMHNMYSQMFYR